MKKFSSRKVRNVFKKLSKIPFRIKLIIFVALALVFAVSFPLICSLAGDGFGKVVGTAVGSFQAVTVDMPAAYYQGKEDGLNAEDIRLDFQNKIREVARLDVLAANAMLTDSHRVGNKYNAIYSFGADVIFSVDLSRAVVYQAEDRMIVTLPRPEGKINIDSTQTRLEYERQKLLFNGTTEEGITAYFNTLEQIQENTSDALTDYRQLQQAAENSAIKQVSMLAETIAGKEKEIEIQFEQEVKGNE